MRWFQTVITVQAPGRGFHLITRHIEEQLQQAIADIEIGILHLFIQHTSASLTINENADPSVRADMESFFTRLVPENPKYYTHTIEGLDDMTSHIKASLLGSSVLLPITAGKLNLGRWQGIYLCEHRNNPPRRRIIATIWGTQRGER